MKRVLSTGASIAALAVPACISAGPALAQEPAAAAPAQEYGVAEIIVTAQRRQENLLDVPIAVTAVTAAALENTGIDASNELPQLIPSVQFTRSGPSGLFFVRGVGTTNGATGEEGANAVYVDNVYMPDLGQTVNRFNNIERVEVLKGPQGTLFGRNATGGLIHIVTRDPPTSGSEVQAELGYGNFETLTGKLYYGQALSEQLRFDVALTGEEQGKGWGRSLVTGEDIQENDFWGVRSKVVFQPSDVLKFTFAGDYFHNKDNTTLYNGVAQEAIQTGGYGPTRGHQSWAGDNVFTDNKLWGLSLTGELDLDFATLTSISAIRRNNTHSLVDVDVTPPRLVSIQIASQTRSFQQELRLASNSTEPLGWQVGVFYLNGKAHNTQAQTGDQFTQLGLAAINIDAAMKTDSIAVFGEATYDLTPTTHVTGGVRYTKDKREFVGGRTLVLLNGVQVNQGQPDPKLDYGEFTYRASIRQDLSDDVNVYASYNRGFKAGAYSLQAPSDPPVQPQFIDAFEIGLKSQLFDRRLRLNLAAYHYDIDDYQIRSTSAASPGSSQLLNAAQVKVDGFDLEFEAAPTRDLSVFGGFTVLNSRFKRFGGPGAEFQAPIIYPNFATTSTTCQPAALGLRDPGVLGTGPRIGGWVSCLGDVSGNRMAMAPKFAASLGATYMVDLPRDRQLRLTGLYSYNSGYYFEPDNVVRQSSFSLLNASAELRLTENVAVEVWGRNLGDKDYAAQKITSATGTAVNLGPPRTYGVTLKLDY